VDLPPKQVAPNPICLETRVMPPPQHRHVKEDICIISSDDDFSLTPHKNKGKQSCVTKLPISRNNSCVQHAPKEKPKIPTQTKTTTPLFGSQSIANFSTTNPQRNLTNFSRAKVEAKALATIEIFIIEGGCELPPPLKEVLMNGLFVLLSKTNIVMDMTLLQNPKACMAIFTSMETIETLCNSFIAAFGQ
jgi:hypothetical protein